MQTVHFVHEYDAPVERLFAFFSEHENLGVIFPLRVERVRDGDGDRNGVGSCRRMSVAGLLPFEETITEVVPNERIAYRITRGSPLRQHSGTMLFTERDPSGSRLEYTISFDAAVPGLAAVVAAGVRRSVGAGLEKVERELGE